MAATATLTKASSAMLSAALSRGSCTPTLQVSAPSPSSYGQFALAQIHGNVCLVQLSSSTPGTASSALTAVEAKIYRHEFITIFRFSHTAAIHPSDIRILESINEQSVRNEEENGTVFLARDVMERLSSLTDRRRSVQMPMKSPGYYARGIRRQ
ncbi:hypothetical protein EW146_g7216 [Bondarzewia mesenterica]|uniref:Uncharacterized protein n=1 Tax=Bondarzewia mesenterica TaxID=1095465 RepID=A0A4V3XEA8_9AGAM|nr:hypothetical protein EW146_g7216 [Bondarzewia mesenterica]